MLLKFKNLTRWHKRLIVLAVDTALIPLSLYLAFSLRFGTLVPMHFTPGSWVLFPLILSLGCVLIYGLRLPQIKLTTFENRAVLQIGLAAILLSTLTVLASYLLGLSAPRSVPLIFGVLFFLSAVLIRVFGLYLLNNLLTMWRRTARARGCLRCWICGHSDGGRLTASTRSTSGAVC